MAQGLVVRDRLFIFAVVHSGVVHPSHIFFPLSFISGHRAVHMRHIRMAAAGLLACRKLAMARMFVVVHPVRSWLGLLVGSGVPGPGLVLGSTMIHGMICFGRAAPMLMAVCHYQVSFRAYAFQIHQLGAAVTSQ